MREHARLAVRNLRLALRDRGISIAFRRWLCFNLRP